MSRQPKSSRSVDDSSASPVGGVDRRRFLQGSVAAGAALVAGSLEARGALKSAPTALAATEDCGVASGDPRPDSVVLWTWIPTAFRSSGGDLVVTWEISTTEAFTSIFRSGTFTTNASRDYTVRLRAGGLSAFTTYYYRFRTSTGFTSVVGRTLTAPLETQDPGSIRFAFISCQNYPAGYYNALATLANEDADFCVHLGDAVYEGGGTGVRTDNVGEVQANRAINLNDWRNKWKLYLSDPNLREVRRKFPWIYVWDDHEVFNNFCGGDPENSQSNRDIQKAAYQAYSEFVPLDPSIVPTTTPEGIPALKIYRSLQFGSMLELFALDSRQYRDGVVCGREVATHGCDDTYAEDRKMLGPEQEAWLKEGLGSSTARWKVLANQVVMMAFKLSNSIVPFFRDSALFETYDGYYMNADQWDGYPAERARILNYVKDNEVSNVVVITGDIHNCFAGTLKPDFADRKSPAVAVELVGGSVTSSGIGEGTGQADVSNLLLRLFTPANPHLVYVDAKYHVYTLLELTATQAVATYVAVDTVVSQTYTSRILSKFTIPDGSPTLIPGQI